MDTTQFEDRVLEIEEYIEFLKLVDIQAQSGKPQLGRSTITTCQQRMLYSSVYLQLYNLVEATATWCTSAVAEATFANGSWRVKQLHSKVRNEWVRTNLRTHTQLGEEKRYDTSVKVCENIIKNLPVEEWEIEKGGGGNWDDLSIEDLSTRVGCSLRIQNSIKRAALRPFRDDRNALRYVKHLRNKLAHGSISFQQSGEEVTINELIHLKSTTVDYLREVVRCFKTYLDGHMYLDSAARPKGDSPP